MKHVEYAIFDSRVGQYVSHVTELEHADNITHAKVYDNHTTALNMAKGLKRRAYLPKDDNRLEVHEIRVQVEVLTRESV